MKRLLYILPLLVSLLTLGQSITTSPIAGPFCVGDAASVSYSATGPFNSGNVFTAQLSDASGDFSNPTTIGSITSQSGGAISVSFPNGVTQGTGYRIRVVSSSPQVTGSDNGSNLNINGPQFSPDTYGNDQWNVFAYDDNNFGTCVGSYIDTDLNFDTRDDWSTTGSPDDATGYIGCALPDNQFSFAFRRKGFDCGTYQFDVVNHDDYIYLSIDGVEVWNFLGWGQSHNNVWTGNLTENSEVEFRVREFGGNALAAINVTFLGPAASLNAIAQYDCNTGSYELSATDATNIQWSPATYLSATNGSPVTATNPVPMTYFVEATSDCDGSTVFDTLELDPAAASVDPDNSFGINEWYAFAYQGTNFDTYLGFYVDTVFNYDTRNVWGSNGSPSDAPSYQGCEITTDNHSLRYRRRGFPCGNYQINVVRHDDDVALFINGEEVWSFDGCCQGHTNIWTGYLGEESILEFRHQEGGGGSYQALEFIKLNEDPTIQINSSFDCISNNTTLVATGGENYTWTPATGLNVDTGSTVISNHNADITYTVTSVAECGGVAVQQDVFVPAVEDIDENDFGNEEWLVLVFADNNFTTLDGYYIDNTGLSFDSRNQWDDEASPADAAGYVGCDNVPINNHSYSFKRQGFPCGSYEIDVAGRDDDAWLYVNGALVWSTTTCCQVSNNVWEGALGPNSTVEFRVSENTGNSLGALNVRALTATPGFTFSKSVDCNVSGEATITVSGGSNFSWSPATGLNTTSGPTVIASPSEEVLYTVTGTHDCDGVTVVEDTIRFTLPPSASDTATFGNMQWNVYCYEGSNFNTFRGRYTTTGASFDTRNDWNEDASPSSASGYSGCDIPANTHSLAFKRQGFLCGDYTIDVTGHDDAAWLYVDDVLVWSNSGCCTTQPNAWSGSLDENSTVIFRYQENAGESFGALRFRGARVDTTVWNGGSSNEWSQSGNWSDGIPDATKSIRIEPGSNNPYINSTLNFENLEIQNGALLTLGPSAVINLSGRLQIEGQIIPGGQLNIQSGCEANTIEGYAAFDNVEINSSNGVEITSGSTLDVYGQLTLSDGAVNINGNLVLKSTDTSTAHLATIAGGSLIGDLTVERRINATQRRWFHVSSPVANTTAADWQNEFPITGNFTGADELNGSNGTSAFWYDETNPSSNSNDDWVAFPQISNTESIVPGRGYRVFLRTNNAQPLNDTVINLIGTPNTGTVDMNVTYTDAGGLGAAGWNFVGNPYPSAINWDAATGWEKVNVENAIYVWDALSGTYRSYVDGVGTNGGENRIASGQAFWIRTSGNNPTLRINENAKVSDTDVDFSRSDQKVLFIAISDGSDEKNTAIRFAEDASMSFDSELDAHYFGGDAAINIGSFDDDNYYSINSTPLIDQEISLYIVQPNRPSTYTLKFTGELPENTEIALLDFYLGSSTPINSGYEHIYEQNTDPASRATTRFALQINPTLVLGNQETENVFTETIIYPNPSKQNDFVYLIPLNKKDFTKLNISNHLGQQPQQVDYEWHNDMIKLPVHQLSYGIHIITVSYQNHTEQLQLVIE